MRPWITGFLIAVSVVWGGGAGPASAQRRVVFVENFSSGNVQGWTLGPEWQIGTAAGSAVGPCSGYGDQDYDADGVYGGGVAGAVIGGLISTTFAHIDYSLESPVIPLVHGRAATLSYARALQSLAAPWMSNKVQVFDGSNWVTIYQSAFGGCVVDVGWQTIVHDVSAYANPAFRVRFSYNVGLAGVSPMPGWSLDNVVVTANVPQAGTAFFSDFSAGNTDGWTMDLTWQIGSAVASGTWACASYGDPGTDADGIAGAGLAGVVIGGLTSSTPTGGSRYLTSPIIPLVPGHTALLTFDRVLRSDYEPYMSHTVEVFNGVGWQTVYHPTQGYCILDSDWQRMTFDVSAHANANFRVRFGYSVNYAGAFASPDWTIDNVMVTVDPGQANSAAASLRVNGVGALGTPGTFQEIFTDSSGLSLQWNGVPSMPFILVGSPTDGPNTSVPGLGAVGVGTAPAYSDVFIIMDGTSFPNSLFATLDSTGQRVMPISTWALPPHFELTIQGIVLQPPSAPSAFVLTATHRLMKL